MPDQTTAQQQSTQDQAQSSSVMFGWGDGFDPASLDVTPLEDTHTDVNDAPLPNQPESSIPAYDHVEENEWDEGSEEHHENEKDAEISAFLGLIDQTREVIQLSGDEEGFSLIGQKTPNQTVDYQVSLFDEDEDDPSTIELFIKKVISTTGSEEEDEHLLQFVYDKTVNTLEIFVDEEKLYSLPGTDGIEATDNVLIKEKIDKFSLLITDLANKIRKEKEEAQKALQKQHQLQEVFRNF